MAKYGESIEGELGSSRPIIVKDAKRGGKGRKKEKKESKTSKGAKAIRTGKVKEDAKKTLKELDFSQKVRRKDLNNTRQSLES